ncbi:A24 family peptidase [Murimonas intestini]|uniref:A24 family peptidase n=1 Tax=Murimonas intestini TaxID=1337051 RepID=UPI0011DD3658|nr:prepilin peptidase [Murimonas intestini]
MQYLQKVCLLFVACSAVISDVSKGKIYNELILTGFFLGAVCQVMDQGVCGILWFLGGLTAPVVLMWPLYYFRMIGAGDIKLFCSLGSILGIQGIFWCMFYSLLIGGGMAAVMVIKRGNLLKRLGYLKCYLERMADRHGWEPYRKKEDRDGEFYFSVPVLISVLFAIGGIY